jgi:transcriptional regulator with XRE-family HTH domain
MALKPEQLLCIEYLAQPKQAGYTMQEIADQCGVSRKTLYEWKKKPEFEAELRRQIKTQVLGKVPDVFDHMYKASQSEGNAAAAKLILQAAEMLTDKLEVKSTGDDKYDIDAMRKKAEEYRNKKSE